MSIWRPKASYRNKLPSSS